MSKQQAESGTRGELRVESACAERRAGERTSGIFRFGFERS